MNVHSANEIREEKSVNANRAKMFKNVTNNNSQNYMHREMFLFNCQKEPSTHVFNHNKSYIVMRPESKTYHNTLPKPVPWIMTTNYDVAVTEFKHKECTFSSY